MNFLSKMLQKLFFFEQSEAESRSAEGIKFVLDCARTIRSLRSNKVTKLFILLGTWAFVGSIAVSFLYGEVKGTAHDFSSKDWSAGEYCITCHASHSESSSMLWNHKTSTAIYQLYANTQGVSVQPGINNVTRFCLSCHDGTVPIDSFGKRNGTQLMNGDALIGTDLRNHHAVSIEYKNGVWHLKDSSSPSGLGGSIEHDLLRNGKVECISCHNIHNKNESNLRFTDNVCVCHRMH